MQAIVIIAGSQYRVKQDDTIVVARLENEIDSKLEFADAITVNDGALKLGGSVSAQVVEHGRDKTVLVFHKKRRKGYQKMNGHRQPYTKLRITGISA
jgi:large subunit ribosomal protein L21